MLNKCPYWHHHIIVLMQMYYYCFGLVVSTRKKLKYSLATSGSCSCKGYINCQQDSSFVPRLTNVWTQISMALPSLAMKCKLHHKLIVIMKKAGSKSLFSHMYCTVQTHLFKLLVRMEFLRILRTNLGTTWQNQSYMHVAVITFNPSHT